MNRIITAAALVLAAAATLPAAPAHAVPASAPDAVTRIALAFPTSDGGTCRTVVTPVSHGDSDNFRLGSESTTYASLRVQGSESCRGRLQATLGMEYQQTENSHEVLPVTAEYVGDEVVDPDTGQVSLLVEATHTAGTVGKVSFSFRLQFEQTRVFCTTDHYLTRPKLQPAEYVGTTPCAG